MYLDGVYQMEEHLRENSFFCSYYKKIFNTQDCLNNCNDVKFNLDKVTSEKYHKVYSSIDRLYLLHRVDGTLEQPQFFYKWLTEEIHVDKSKVCQLYADFGEYNGVCQNPRVVNMIIDFLIFF
ncbi:unnamed protein product [Ambrosiozyma monospora]|uniref:Unnamed protein product n=1 Tax=Ambrosiozyma monospora TaxID=43982 RepID=A0ACB5TCU5_AMBMO|nr:unnamed protein product [Ambrosiozyma monospora]